ncbi:DUF1217 domain-containing protein [Arenibaculum pallidiluteum]|uniref:DUF1217 domain-containing protein n=1 Tax=Arenibaculum pallidiluteum TaxID=2812559 RepID=UPI001A95B723|nr:DUF1217 domain-containing protein [Arenibaculum pallidiluteum]
MATLTGLGSSAFTLFKMVEKQGSTAVERHSKDPAVTREVQYFREKVGSLKSVDDIFSDYRMMSFVLKASNLEDEIPFPGRAKRALTERADNTDALMNRLTDKRFKAAAEALKFAETGLSTLKNPETIEKLVSSYAKISYEKTLGLENIAVPKARYFQEKIGQVENYYDILGDKILRDVVTTALNIPQELAFQEVETQAAALEARIKLDDLKDPDTVAKFTQRYLIMMDQKNMETNGGGQSWLLNLFA